ncbi:MAG: hypothetical protein QXH80_01810 [Candidatus Nanoarchaeia archaeon]
MKFEEVRFEEPTKFLDIKNSEPTPQEALGITLRFSKPKNGKLEYIEKTQIFVQIEKKEGLPISFATRNEQIFEDGKTGDSWLLRNITTVEDSPEQKSDTEIEMNSRGEILRFIRGEHMTKDGKLIIQDWKREAIFPDFPVKAGDKWKYKESIDTKLHSFWIKRENESPDSVEVACTLEGFADVNGKRCAIISSRIKSVKEEKISAIFKKIQLRVTSFGTEKMYFDYKEGCMIGKIVETKHFTISAKGDFSDYTESQTITVLRNL